MEKDLRLLVGNINQTLRELDYVSYLKKVALSKGKKGEYQSHRLKSNYLKRKLKGLMDRLTNKLKGTILTVTYQVATPVNTKTFEQTFTNLTQQEIVDIMQIRAIMEGVEINILEIKEIPTQIREV